jgi:hypothetical protein
MSDSEIVLDERLKSSLFSYEYSTITLRTPEGWLLWSSAQHGDDTLGDVLKQASRNLAIHERKKGI